MALRIVGILILLGLAAAGGRAILALTERHDEDLVHAAVAGNLPELQKCLNAGTDPDTRGPNGFTALHFMALRGDMAAVRLLIEKGADVSARTEGDGFTPLHCVARGGNLDVARLLLEKGADPHAKSQDGLTPAAVAARKGNKEMAHLLHGEHE